MHIYMTKNVKQTISMVIFILIVIFLCFVCLHVFNEPIKSVFGIGEELQVSQTVQQIFKDKNKAVIDGDINLIKDLYDTNTMYGKWAYEYEQRRIRYINNWEQKQGVSFIEIIPKVLIKKIKKSQDMYIVNLQATMEYKYIYNDAHKEVNSCKVGTYHILELINKDEKWVIKKEWYKDPFGDYLNLDNLNLDNLKNYILSQKPTDFCNINERRIKAVEYADKYNGASNYQEYEFKYNKKYRNYNSRGGDCANFASQVLFEGGKFRKNSAWNYDKRGATYAWLNANGFTKYMLNSNRASLIARGNYKSIFKNSYKLLPGDFIAYEDNGDITHVSVVTGADSKGYSLVSCHNTDRNRVPWDLGWSKKSIKFWFIRVHY